MAPERGFDDDSYDSNGLFKGFFENCLIFSWEGLSRRIERKGSTHIRLVRPSVM